LAALLEVCQLGFYYYPTQLDKVPSGALVAAQKALGAAMRVFQMLRSFLQLPKQALHTHTMLHVFHNLIFTKNMFLKIQKAQKKNFFTGMAKTYFRMVQALNITLLKRKLWRKKKNKEGARYIFHDN
jgi:hypothetical protein